MKLIRYILLVSLLMPLSLFAQKEGDDLRVGNKHYKNEKYTEAEIEYRKALQKNDKSFEANYNLANAFFKQGKYDQAFEYYKKALPLATDKKKLAYEFHNIGNTLMAGNKIQEAIEAYKMALKNNPKDNETRYNLAYAQAQLKKQQNQNDSGGQNKDNQQQPDEQKQPEQKPDEQSKNEQPQPQHPQMSKENAQQILQALEQDEKETQEKAKNAQRKAVRRAEKDW